MFILHVIQGYKHNEIAGMLGCSVGNSKSQVRKARMRLRELLRKAPGHSKRRHCKSVPLSIAMGWLKYDSDWVNA